MRSQGIYQISNLINNKVYIGQVHANKGYSNRIQEHINQLKRKKHFNIILQRSWNKYGSEAFDCRLVEYVADASKLNEREQYWIDQTWYYSYNIRRTAAGGSLGCSKRSKTARQKITEANAKRVWKKSSRMKASVSQKKRFSQCPVSEETKDKMRIAQVGRKHTDKTKHKIKKALTDRVFTNEHRHKISDSKKGKQQSLKSIEKQSKKLRMKHGEGRSKYKGVDQRGHLWRARIVVVQKEKLLGYFTSEEVAAENVDYHRIALFGRSNTWLNFPKYNYNNFKPKKSII